MKSQSLGRSGPNPEFTLGGILFYCWFETITKLMFPTFSSHRSRLGFVLFKVRIVMVKERKRRNNVPGVVISRILRISS